MQLDEQRLRFRDAMASLSAAVNVVTTAGEAGRCGITATAVCSVTDTPPSVMVCINANSAMNPVFQGNGKLCINVLNHEQEIMARHFAGMTGVTMEERFALSGWRLKPVEYRPHEDPLHRNRHRARQRRPWHSRWGSRSRIFRKARSFPCRSIPQGWGAVAPSPVGCSPA